MKQIKGYNYDWYLTHIAFLFQTSYAMLIQRIYSMLNEYFVFIFKIIIRHQILFFKM